MDVIARIVETEKQSAMDIDRAEETCRVNIEAHRHALEEEKERTRNLIIQKENSRLAEALRALNERTKEASLAEGQEYESLFRDPAAVHAVKEKIVAVLLEG